MKTDTLFLLTTIWLCLLGCQRHKQPALTSPDGRIQATIEPLDGSAPASLVFCMQKADDHCQRVLEVSRLGIGTEKGQANEYCCHFKDQQQKEVCLRLRLYNDGAAFRYELADLQEERITGEETTYCILEGTRRWMQKYSEAYEEFFPMATSGQQENRHWGYPALVQCNEEADTWALNTILLQPRGGFVAVIR
ncbi:MAG: glycoside hydrolase family 97 N-terminal domain-containing protein [Bacteroides sp.]